MSAFQGYAQRTRRQRRIDRATHLFATAVCVAMVVVPMILFDAPTWAWWGIGAAVWLSEVKWDTNRIRGER